MIDLLLAAALVTKIGTFNVVEDTDPVSDLRYSVAELVSGNTSLLIGCSKVDPTSVRVLFVTGQYSDASPIVTVRFDQGRASREVWSTAGANVEAGVDYKVNDFATRLMVAHQVVLRMETVSGHVVDGVFKVDGAQQALRQVSQTCGDGDFRKAIGAPAS